MKDGVQVEKVIPALNHASIVRWRDGHYLKLVTDETGTSVVLCDQGGNIARNGYLFAINTKGQIERYENPNPAVRITEVAGKRVMRIL